MKKVIGYMSTVIFIITLLLLLLPKDFLYESFLNKKIEYSDKKIKECFVELSTHKELNLKSKETFLKMAQEKYNLNSDEYIEDMNSLKDSFQSYRLYSDNFDYNLPIIATLAVDEKNLCSMHKDYILFVCDFYNYLFLFILIYLSLINTFFYIFEKNGKDKLI